VSTADPTVLSQTLETLSQTQSKASPIQLNNAVTSGFAYLALDFVQRTSPTALWVIAWKTFKQAVFFKLIKCPKNRSFRKA
jgi:hypothetical protein